MAEVSVTVGNQKTSWDVPDADGVQLIGIFGTVIRGADPIVTTIVTTIEEEK